MDNASENASESNTEQCGNDLPPVVAPAVGPPVVSASSSVPVLFQDTATERTSMQQRPKSANKQSKFLNSLLNQSIKLNKTSLAGTATPNSIANECAVATEQKSISVVASPDQLAGGKDQQNWTTILSSRGSTELSPTRYSQQGQHKQKATGSNTFQLPSTSSSAASTPTHLQKSQKDAAVVKAPAPDPVVAAVAPSNMSRKNQRKVQKRKEQEKKKQKAAATVTNTSTANSNNIGNNNNVSNNAKSGAASNAKGNNNNICGATTGGDTSITTFATITSKQTTTNAVADKAMATTTTDKLSATSNNSSLSYSLREKQPKDRTGNSSNHNDDSTGEKLCK